MKNKPLLFCALLCVLLTASCSDDGKNQASEKEESVSEKESLENQQTSTFSSRVNEKEDEKGTLKIVYGEDKEKLKTYYELPHIKEFYDWNNLEYTPSNDFSYPSDLTSLSYEELRLLRNEIFARNGYLFSDGFLRGYFNRFDWYMPIFDVEDFEISLNQKERDLVNKILAEEKKRKERKTVSQGDLQLYNADLIANKQQFEVIPKGVEEDFHKQNFSLVATNRAMPFYAYDENAYQYIPHYITTDLYLFILHKYFSRSLEKLDENYMYGQLKTLLENASQKINTLSGPASEHQATLEWAQMYTSLALYALGDAKVTAPEAYTAIFQEEKKKIDALKGNPSFIENSFVSYQELKPRGHYTKSDNLKKYFKGFKWLSLNGIDLDNKEQLKGLLVFAHTIKNDEKLFKQYQQYVSVIERLAGQEDNLSLSDIMRLLKDQSLEEILNEDFVASVKDELNRLNKEKIKTVFGKTVKAEVKNARYVYFLSSTYSISGEIFSKLVHVDQLKSKRPFPKGLDVPAVFGNQTAQNILVNEYKDHEAWPEYLPKLNQLQDHFKNFENWDHNYGFKGVQTALAASAEHGNYPDFMKTDAYNRKELSTTLASWTHIKHDLILYQEKPHAAEAGQGGGPEPPEHYSYVEPNLEFWDTALELVEWLETLAKYETSFESELSQIKELGENLRTVAYKQIEGKTITKEEYDELHYVGGTVEYILLSLLETDHLPDRERSMALIADVYAYNGTNLNVAVGHADDIYTIVPIKGEYYIARGSVFSYYEFTGRIYNDEEWKQRIADQDVPERPKWIGSILKEGKPLKGTMQYRY
ncbi:DUF3160 domain-containing protein [Rapidithrix thailandica]|uniref:DUF3160 domain-containing protein n=1 Tax=Rapidithrix thailandica TaxID=413964 RepID=A0AAW9SDY1_9BACT